MGNYLVYLAYIPLLYLGYQIHLYLFARGWSPYLTFAIGLVCGVIIIPFLALNILSFVKYKFYDSHQKDKFKKSE